MRCLETMTSKTTILGHPIHPMMVGFPVALYTATVVAYALYAATGSSHWFQVGVVANIAGVVAASLTAVPGLIDWMGIPSADSAKHTGLLHMLLNVTALSFFAVDAFLQYGHWDEPSPAFGTAVTLAAVGFVLTLVAGFLGWTLVHRSGIEVTAGQQVARTPLVPR
jgi:uncharacterized membrane protein